MKYLAIAILIITSFSCQKFELYVDHRLNGRWRNDTKVFTYNYEGIAHYRDESGFEYGGYGLIDGNKILIPYYWSMTEGIEFVYELKSADTLLLNNVEFIRYYPE